VCYENKYGKEIEIIAKDYIEFLKKLPHGVMEYDFEFGVVSKSINFAMVENENIILSLRANSNEKLNELKEYIKEKCANLEIVFEDEYPAWKPEITPLAQKLKDITKSEFRVIHAGLECAVLKNKFPNVDMASIGPLIENPHSLRERVNLNSINKILDTIEKLLQTET